MPRHLEFDRDLALLKATALFRKQGFAGTSMDELATAMDIGRSSLYHSFGNKRQLYLEALQRHLENSVFVESERLDAASSPKASILGILDAPGWADDETRALGCFSVGALSEFGTADGEVFRLTEWADREITDKLVSRVSEGQAIGEFNPTFSPSDCATYIQTILAGLQLAGRGGAGKEELRRNANFAIALLLKRQ